MPQIFVDNKSYDVKGGQHLLEACLSLRFNLPYFCWHPAMQSVGACRQCAVKQFKDENDKEGKIVMACMTPAADGMRISIEDPEAREFRAHVIEWLMLNHPHDCPICDEGGECHLQDMTVMTGHAYRRCRFQKRTHRNQYLGPFINHEMNRCIQCYRCVRFYREYAGGRDFDVFGAHDNVYFGRQDDGVLESEFSGNLVEVCPTGVFTDKSLKEHYTRKWDMQTAPSVCVHCSLGCNTIPGERYGKLRRMRNRYNGEVNGYFICDRGRYGYEFVNSEERLHSPLINTRLQPGGQRREESGAASAASTDREKPLKRLNVHRPVFTGLKPGVNDKRSEHEISGSECGKAAQSISKEDAIQHVAKLVADKSKVIGIGSPRASLEANFALRTLVGSENFHSGASTNDSHLVATALEILQRGPARTPSLHEVEQCDATLVLGEDVLNTAPRLALSLRQSVRNEPAKHAAKLKIPLWNDAGVREATVGLKGPLFIAAPHATRLDDSATQTIHGAPDDIARFGFAVAHELDSQAPAPGDLPEEERKLAKRVAVALQKADRPLVVSGTGCASEAVLQAAANVAWALCRENHAAGLCLTLPECNSVGLGSFGGKNLEAAVQAVQSGQADTVIILENDLFRRADASTVNALLEKAPHVIAMDHLENSTTVKANIILPAAAFAEASGTLVNNEGRAQRFYRTFVPQGDIQESWRWLRDMMNAAGRTEAESWTNLDAIDAALVQEIPAFRLVEKIAPPADYSFAGLRIPREPHRYSGRTAMHANVNVHEPKPPDDPDSPLAFSMEGLEQQPPSPFITHFWAPGWNSIQALNKFQSEIAGPLVGGDPGQRLIEPPVGVPKEYFSRIPEPFKSRKNEWLAIPLHHIFGSEELSVLSPGIAQRSPHAYLGLNEADVRRVGVKEGQEIDFKLSGESHRLPVRIIHGLPDDVAGIPVGLRSLGTVSLPARITIGGDGK